jgi:hypothetical protein
MAFLQVASEFDTAREYFRTARDLAYPLETRSVMIVFLVALPVLLCLEGFPSAQLRTKCTKELFRNWFRRPRIVKRRVQSLLVYG